MPWLKKFFDWFTIKLDKGTEEEGLSKEEIKTFKQTDAYLIHYD